MKVRAAKNVLASWLSLLTHVAVGFFVSPFILHRLGDDAFGVWVLAFSLTGYYGLLDLGIRQSVIRHVAKFSATRDADKLTRFVNTCLFTYGIISLLVLLATGLCAFYFPALFRISPNLVHTARIVTLLVGTGMALGFPLSVFAGILAGLQEFYRPHTVRIIFTLLRGLLVMVVLTRGGGLIGITLVTVGLNILTYAFLIPMLPRDLNLHFGFGHIDKQAWNSISSYSFLAFLIIVADKLRFQSDALVIGMLASAGAVTYFAVGSKLVEYAGLLVQGLSQIFVPMSSEFDATGDLENLRKVAVVGNRACALTIFPICSVLIVMGKPIIAAWVGEKYLSSYLILVLLLVPKTLYLAQSGSVKVLLGTGRHRSLAFVLVLEGIANLLLSVVLVGRMGIQGVALGTAVPLLITSLFYLPNHVCRQLNIGLSTYLKDAYLLPLGLCAPLVASLLFLQLIFAGHQYSTLFLQVATGITIYSTGFLLLSRLNKPTRTARSVIKIGPTGQEPLNE